MRSSRTAPPVHLVLADHWDMKFRMAPFSCSRADLQGPRITRPAKFLLDLKSLAGSVLFLLTSLLHLNAVLITLWDVEPLPVKSATRTANVAMVERTKHQRGYPQVRLLIQNPNATAPLTEREEDAFRQIL